jgi:hypothetical protein
MKREFPLLWLRELKSYATLHYICMYKYIRGDIWGALGIFS